MHYAASKGLEMRCIGRMAGSCVNVFIVQRDSDLERIQSKIYAHI